MSNNNNSSKTIIITGASSGVGLSCARHFARKGWRVYDLSRSGRGENGVTHIGADLANPAQIEGAVRQIVKDCGAVSALVNNAGFGISGAVENVDLYAARKLFEVNFFGALSLIKLVIPIMRDVGSGRIVNISSIAGALPVPYQAVYSASKAAVTAATLALDNEIRQFGVRACVVAPGDVRTNFTDTRIKDETSDDVYRNKIKRAVAAMEKDERNGMPPEKVSKIVYKAVIARRPRPVYNVGASYRALALAAKFLPLRLVNAIEGAMYG